MAAYLQLFGRFPIVFRLESSRKRPEAFQFCNSGAAAHAGVRFHPEPYFGALQLRNGPSIDAMRRVGFPTDRPAAWP